MGACPLPLWQAPGGFEDDAEPGIVSGVGKCSRSVVLPFANLVKSFLSVPLVSLQSLVAWQYNKIGGFGQQKTILHNVCTYVLRLSLMLWLATSVSGLVVAAQQVYCLPEGSDASYWRVGTSCAFHRATVIVSVISL